MKTATAPTPAAPATAAPTPAAAAPKESVNGLPAELPTPGTELGILNDGVAVVASGVRPGQPKTATNFKDAGKAFLASLTEGERTVGEEMIARAQVDNEVARLSQRPAATTGSEGAESEEEMEEGEGEGEQPGSELWLDEQTGRWRDKDGRFVEAAPPTDAELAAAGVTREQLARRTPAAPDKGKKNEAAAGQPVAIKLAGAPERGEEDLELEIDDPDVAQRIQRLQNEGMRRQAYNEAMADVESQRAELQAIGSALEQDPVGFALNQMTRERQLEVAEALLIEHFDALVGRINEFTDDPVSRQQGRVALRDRLAASRDEMQDSRARQSHAAACMRTAQGLLPEGVDDATAQMFMADAENDLIRAAKSGRPVTPDTVPLLLKHRARIYGFGETGPGERASGASALSRSADPGTARPLTDKARAIAEKKREASEAQKRIRRVQVQRRGAAAVAPTGIGAATLQVPVLSDNDMTDVHAASKALRKLNLGNSWAPAGAR